MIVKNEDEKKSLREAGKRLGNILHILSQEAKAGMTSAELNDRALTLIEEGGDSAAFLDYTPHSAKRPFPAALCVSINNEVVHGIPNEKPRTLKDGDIVSLDLGLTHQAFIVDAAVTVAVGKIDEEAKRLLRATSEALEAGIAQAKVGNTIGDISFAIGASIKKSGFAPANELGGHGVGRQVHEEPYIANWGKRGEGEKIVEGMVLALEPIVNEGTSNIKQLSDGYTIVTRDGKRSAHFEHTILVAKEGPEILTA